MGGYDKLANTKSAEKRIRVTAKKTLRNRSIKSAMKTRIRKFEKALAQGVTEETIRFFREATSAIDKAASKGVIHRNQAARRKSRLAAKLSALSKAQQA